MKKISRDKDLEAQKAVEHQDDRTPTDRVPASRFPKSERKEAA